MKLSQIIVELRHAEPLKLFLPYEQLFQSLTNQELPQKDIPLPGFELNIADKQMRVVVEPRRTAVILGDVPNIGYCVDNVTGVFRKISELVKLPKLRRIGARSYWVEEANYDFSELVSIFKRTLFKSNAIVEQSTDVGASFTLTDGEYNANVTFGPMELAQLKTFFRFEPPKLPNVSMFLDVDYYLKVDEPKEMTDRIIHDFVGNGLNFAVKKSKIIADILWRQKGG